MLRPEIYVFARDVGSGERLERRLVGRVPACGYELARVTRCRVVELDYGVDDAGLCRTHDASVLSYRGPLEVSSCMFLT